jgi:7-carboxy-7-deazaguanine synthase
MALTVNEIFRSIQGESTWSGCLCTFVRLTGCNLRCSFCDTTYAYEQGEQMSLEEVLGRVRTYSTSLVEITGGEPLLQAETPGLAQALLSAGHKVLVETNGSLNIGGLPEGVIRVVDVKCPGSGMADRMHWRNLELLRPGDEVKFVITARPDYDWAKAVGTRYRLFEQVAVLFSPAFDRLRPEELANWMVHDNLPARFQVQLHKVVWGPAAEGV